MTINNYHLEVAWFQVIFSYLFTNIRVSRVSGGAGSVCKPTGNYPYA